MSANLNEEDVAMARLLAKPIALLCASIVSLGKGTIPGAVLERARAFEAYMMEDLGEDA